MIILVGIGSPKRSQQWKLKLFPTISPEIIDGLCKLLKFFHFSIFFVLFFDEVCNPSFGFRQH